MTLLESLPLFPLHTVLFPEGLLPLKVFEQRYVEMTKACLRDERPFGVCLIVEGDEVARGYGSVPEIARVGTLARINDVDMPQMGILHVATQGGGRFEVRSRRVDGHGLLVADVSMIDDEPSHALAEAYAPLGRLLELIATRLGPGNFPSVTRYDDASWVGHRLAELLPLPLSIKQRMLEVSDANVRLAALAQFLERQGVLQAV
ncbi:MAG TPA: LON peptidase substrate-binding domain-containing protein [Casimicrobiaceae bacterium]|jgi:Lon protease-like protein|nr:LON peptidase substrate-binding domain-containing protein [Casimicrobiaceae bacterium]